MTVSHWVLQTNWLHCSDADVEVINYLKNEFWTFNQRNRSKSQLLCWLSSSDWWQSSIFLTSENCLFEQSAQRVWEFTSAAQVSCENVESDDQDSVSNRSSNERWEEIVVWNEYNHRNYKIVQDQIIKEDKMLQLQRVWSLSKKL